VREVRRPVFRLAADFLSEAFGDAEVRVRLEEHGPGQDQRVLPEDLAPEMAADEDKESRLRHEETSRSPMMNVAIEV